MSVDHTWILHFFFLYGDPDVLVLLELQDLVCLAQLSIAYTFDDSKDQRISSTVPFEGVELLFIDYCLELV